VEGKDRKRQQRKTGRFWLREQRGEDRVLKTGKKPRLGRTSKLRTWDSNKGDIWWGKEVKRELQTRAEASLEGKNPKAKKLSQKLTAQTKGEGKKLRASVKNGGGDDHRRND